MNARTMTSVQANAGGDLFADEVLMGASAAVERMRLQVARFAPHFRTVLLVGEHGTGKQTIARELHRTGPRAGLPFVAMPIDDFVQRSDRAASGMLYLCGLAAMPAELQAGLLGRLNGLTRETRVVISCAGDPRGLVAAGRLRADVAERLGMLGIRVASLRERLEDVPAMTASMLGRLGCTARPAPEDVAQLLEYDWPHNLAELWRACEQFAAVGRLRLDRGPQYGTGDMVRLEHVVERHVKDVLERCAGNKLRAAELLGISRSTLYRMLDATTS